MMCSHACIWYLLSAFRLFSVRSPADVIFVCGTVITSRYCFPCRVVFLPFPTPCIRVSTPAFPRVFVSTCMSSFVASPARGPSKRQ